MDHITVVIPTHGERLLNGMTEKAIGSVLGQTHPATSLIVENDHAREGAAINRHRGLMKVTTEWVAFLDSDDYFYPQHLEALYAGAIQSNADYTFSHPITWGGYNPFEADFGKPFDPENPRHTTITTMVRTELAQSVGFLNYNKPVGFGVSNEDWLFMEGCLRKGARIVHVPEKTWLWNMHGRNTGGLPGQGDAPRA